MKITLLLLIVAMTLAEKVLSLLSFLDHHYHQFGGLPQHNHQYHLHY